MYNLKHSAGAVIKNKFHFTCQDHLLNKGYFDVTLAWLHINSSATLHQLQSSFGHLPFDKNKMTKNN